MTYWLNEKEKVVINGKTGDIIRPTCIDDLILYHRYILATEGEKVASSILKRVVEGEKIISNLVEYAGFHKERTIKNAAQN